MTDNLEMIIEVRGLAHGQPRSYADRQDIYEVTVQTQGYVRVEGQRQPEWQLGICTHPKMLEQIARGAVRAPDGLGRSTEAFRSYTAYVHHVAQDGTELVDDPEYSETGTVRIRIVTPYCD
jgi:hypothetical protein